MLLNNTKTAGVPETCTVSRISSHVVTERFLILTEPVITEDKISF